VLWSWTVALKLFDGVKLYVKGQRVDIDELIDLKASE
jgi:hypothetical protein